MADNKNFSKAQVKQIVINMAKTYGVPVDLALALANHESGFNSKAISKAGAIGVMQLMPGTARGLGVNPYDIVQNIEGGIKYLKQQLTTFGGDVQKALAAYNAGPAAVQKHGGVPPYKETRNYVKSITSQVPRYQQEVTTGAAADITPEELKGIDERLADVSANMIEQAKEGIKTIASNPYDALMAEYQRARREKEADAAINKIVTQTPINPTQEQITQAQKPFVDASGNIVNLTKEGMKQLQEMQAAAKYQQYEQALKQAYADQIAALDARNPYTRMGQIAPLQSLEAIDIDELKRRQAGDAFGTRLAYISNPSLGHPDYAAMRAAQQSELERAQQFNRAQAMARQTGLEPQEFIQGGLMDYNTAGTALAAQNAQLANIYARAMQGDVQAQQFLTNLVTNATGQLNTSATNAANALHQLRADQLAAAKENRERQFAALNYKGGLDSTALTGSNAVQQQNIASGASMYNTGVNAGVNAGGNVLDYTVDANRINTQNADGDGTALDPQQQFLKLITPVSNYYSQSNDPNAMNNYNYAMNRGAKYAGFDEPLTDIMFNVPNGFTPQNVNTFTPQQ